MNKRDDMQTFAASSAYQERASRVLPRGVSSSPRATQRPVPLVIARADGARVTDIDGRTYVDYAMGYGPLILGHTPAPVLDAVRRELSLGLRVGGVAAVETELGERIASLMPGAAMSSFLSTGTEACQLALRIARAVTGRMNVVKFRCHYHGWSDAIHLATEPGHDGPSTGGQEPDALRHVTVLDWGDPGALSALPAGDIAAVIMEPAAINAGCFEPPAGFLERVRAWTAQHGIVLVFDEVITGFRMALGGAQHRYGVAPDITVLGKALGAGLPISAVSGSAAMLEPIVSGAVSQRGTYNGNPLSAAAAVACLDHLTANANDIYPRMERFATAIADHVRDEARRLGAPVTANRAGPCVQLFAGASSVPTLSYLGVVDRESTLELTGALVERGVAALPRGMMYLSAAHTDDDIALTLKALTGAIAAQAQRC
jgi:glutamate-1-semialdehyde 2,1-aminomutase